MHWDVNLGEAKPGFICLEGSWAFLKGAQTLTAAPVLQLCIFTILILACPLAQVAPDALDFSHFLSQVHGRSLQF